MSDKKISELSAATTINQSDVSVLVSGGVDYKFAFSTLLQFLGTNLAVGANISFGTTLPQNTAGKNGDVFINTTTGSFAQKISGAWNIVYSLPSVNSLTDGTVLYGLGVPGASIGNNNDTYIDTGIGVFYKKVASSWGQVFSMQTGPQGPQGTAGTNGTNGINGFTILNGGTNPSNLSTGINGDFYINTANYTFFGPKTAGAWPEGVSLVPPGVIAGGSTGQALTKASDDDYDTEWIELDDLYVRLDGSYSNPAFINSIAWSKISSKPTTMAGYGITDFNTLGDTRWLQLSGGTLTDDVQQPVSPVNANSLITKSYVDNLVTGLTWKKEVKAGTVSNITLFGTQTIDGIALIAGDRVLVKNQTTSSQNGIYVVATGSWARATDADTTGEIEGATVMVRLGTVNNNTQWTNTNSNEPVIDTDDIAFGQIAGAGTYTNGTGINLTANVFSLDSSYAELISRKVTTLNNSTTSYPSTSAVTTALGSYVPYTGATGAVSLGANSLSVNYDNNTVLASIPNGINLVSNTVASIGSPIQFSPALYFASSVAQPVGAGKKLEIRQYATYGNSNQYFSIDYNLGSAGWVNMMTMGSGGVSVGNFSAAIITATGVTTIVSVVTPQIFTSTIRPTNIANATILFSTISGLSVAGNQFTFDGGVSATNSSGLLNVVKLQQTYNQTGTASSNDFLINRTETALGSGAHLFADFQIGGASRFKVDRTGAITSTNNGIGTTATDGLVLTNTTASTTPNNHQFSPALRFSGSRFNAGVSQQVETRMYSYIDGSNSNLFQMDYRIGGTGSYNPVFNITAGGAASFPGTVNVSGNLNTGVILVAANQYIQTPQVIGYAGQTLAVRGESNGSSTNFTATKLYNFTAHINSSGVMNQISIEPTYNQTGTAGSIDFLINRNETAIGSGTHLIADFRVGGVSKFKIDRAGLVTVAKVYTGGEISALGSGITSPDGMGAINVTMPADGNAYAMLGVTRLGGTAVGLGMGPTNNFIIGWGTTRGMGSTIDNILFSMNTVTGDITSTGYIKGKTLKAASYNVAGLPTGGGISPGDIAYATDATTTTRGSIVAGGGGNGIPVFFNGTDWIIL
jgi:hypothetical protein